MFFYLYRDAATQWRWTLYAANNRKIANSGEGYHNKADAIAAINLVKVRIAPHPFGSDAVAFMVNEALRSPAIAPGFSFQRAANA